MSRGYWLTAITVGLICLLPPHYGWTGEKEQAQSQQINIPPPPFGIFEHPDEPDRTGEPCAEGEEKRYSDLCAQWKAADAAKDSADWTRRTFWLGVGGFGIGFLTLVAAGAAAFYAKKAAEETKRGACAAEDAVTETRRIGESQVRAYITCIGAEICFDDEYCQLAISFANKGQSPARDVSVIGYAEYRPKNDWYDLFPSGKVDKISGMCEMISAGDTGVARVMIASVLFDNAALGHLLCRHGEIGFLFDVSWKDVFKETLDIRIFLDERELRKREARSFSLKPIGDGMSWHAKMQAQNRAK